MDDLLRDFLTESMENIAAVDDQLVRLEQNPNDAELISGIFRLVHTIKGTCGFLALTRLEKVAHAAENVLGKLRDRELVVTPAIVTTILAAIDRIKIILARLDTDGKEGEGDDLPLIATLNAACVANADIATPAVETPPSPEPEASPAPVDGGVSNQTIRVRVDLLENLMTTVSELVLTRNQLLQLLRTDHNSAFASPLQRLSQVVSELQDGVMKARMQPIGGAWSKLPRLIRDLARDLGKKITLDMRGAETELDRQVLDLIKDPLTHMIRNCADHGLETPADRLAAGKPETGRILLNACHQGGYIIVTISDDGRGLNADRIRKKVLANGLATEAELQTMSDTQLYQYIFRPGFSTAEAVTAVSGRGVGMDVVRTNIEKIGGSVELRSTPGEGSCFSIKIPLTLAIVSALIVEAGGQRYAIPQNAVGELVRAGGDGQMIERIGQAAVLRLRDRLLPLIELQSLWRTTNRAAADDHVIVVVQVDDQSFGLIVDRVFDTEEIVVKPVAPVLRSLPVFSGNTILGDGSVIMILDPKGVAHRAGIEALEKDDMLDHNAIEATRSTKDMLLIATVGEGAPIGVPLSRIARLEEFDPARAEWAQGQLVTQYRDRLMPLSPLGQLTGGVQPMLVFTDNDRNVGLVVQSIVDIVDQGYDVDWRAGCNGLTGSAIIAGRATDLLDVDYHTAPLFATAANDLRRAA